MTWSDEYKAKVREFIADKGDKVELRDDDWQEVSTFGWHDYEASKHIRPWDQKGVPCKWIVPEGAVLTEKTYSLFTDTFHSNENEVGVNVVGASCACGKYTDVTIRWVGSVTEMLHSILGIKGKGGLEVEL